MAYRRILTALVVALLGPGLAACDPSNPADRQAFYDLNPAVSAEDLTATTMNESQRAVIKALQDQQTAYFLGIIASRSRLNTDCVAAMQSVWPAHMHGWAMGIMKRESGLLHTADNPSSSAAGCWQMLSMHNWRYAEVGCSSADIYNALCNNKAAYHLYQQAGTSPWSL